MNLELSDLTVALLAVVFITAMAIRNRRRLQLRVSPKCLEVDLEPSEQQEK